MNKETQRVVKLLLNSTIVMTNSSTPMIWIEPLSEGACKTILLEDMNYHIEDKGYRFNDRQIMEILDWINTFKIESE